MSDHCGALALARGTDAMEGLLETFLKTILVEGTIDVLLPSGRVIRVGTPLADSMPLAVKITDSAAVGEVLRDPELAFGELFMDGRVEPIAGTIYDILALLARNLARHSSRWMTMMRGARRVMRRLEQRNNLARARRNVAHHYDLDARLYALFLDSDRQYSCAYFEDANSTLEEAQLAKKRHIAAKLLLQPGQSVLDIGCGWGGLALYLAKNCDAHVDGVTLSEEQLAFAQRRARDSGLDGRVAFSLQDYRRVDKTYDRIVSVGMFEHVGVGYYDDYFERVAQLMADDGVALIHTIGRKTGPSITNPWIAKYIFPGGYIPALSEIMPAVERAGLFVTDVEVLRLHYAETLRAWRERFMARRDEAKALYDERFCRMWEFYLAGSECAFRFNGDVVFQLQLSKNVDAVPMTRTYIEMREAQLRQRESAAQPLRLAGE